MEKFDYLRHSVGNRYLLDRLVRDSSDIESALKTIDHMYFDKIITKKKHDKLAKSIYGRFENRYVKKDLKIESSRIAAGFFFVFGIFIVLNQAGVTGNAVGFGSNFNGGGLIGGSLVFVSLALLYFLRKF